MSSNHLKYIRKRATLNLFESFNNYHEKFIEKNIKKNYEFLIDYKLKKIYFKKRRIYFLNMLIINKIYSKPKKYVLKIVNYLNCEIKIQLLNYLNFNNKIKAKYIIFYFIKRICVYLKHKNASKIKKHNIKTFMNVMDGI